MALLLRMLMVTCSPPRPVQAPPFPPRHSPLRVFVVSCHYHNQTPLKWRTKWKRNVEKPIFILLLSVMSFGYMSIFLFSLSFLCQIWDLYKASIQVLPVAVPGVRRGSRSCTTRSRWAAGIKVGHYKRRFHVHSLGFPSCHWELFLP